MNATEKLYYQNNRSIIFEAKILEQYRDKKGWVIILDKTLFYPEGGGQPADKGWLNDIPVNSVHKKDEFVLHHVSKEIKTDTVKGKIDWEHRFDYMQQHTGQHLISGALWKIGQFKTVSVNMSVDYTTIEIESKRISEEELNAVEDLANRIILKNLPVSYAIINDSEISKFNLRRPCLISGDIRLISLGDFDSVACGGVHLDLTGEVRLVKIIKVEKIRGNTRIYWKIGDRAYLDYHNKSEMISRLKILLNSNGTDLDKKVDQLKDEISDIKIRKNQLGKKLIGFHKESLLKKTERGTQYNIIIEGWKNEDDQFILNLVKSIIIEKNIIVCFVNRSDKSSKWIIGCSDDVEVDFNNIRENLLKPFDCKGGGKYPIWQGIGELENKEEFFLKSFKEIIGKKK